MPIEQLLSGGTIIYGENSLRYVRLVSMRAALELEVRCPGVRAVRGQTIMSRIKHEFDIKGSTKAEVLKNFETYIDAEYPNARSAQ